MGSLTKVIPSLAMQQPWNWRVFLAADLTMLDRVAAAMAVV
jgi:hypothetical protein